MRLKINCDVCDTRKVNEDNYKEDRPQKDVAFIGPWGVMGVFGSIFGRPGSGASDASDTKYINADFYEL